MSYEDGQCNGDLPNDSVYTRFLYTVRYLTANNFYVVLDNQLNTDPTATMDSAVWAPLPLFRQPVLHSVLNAGTAALE